MIDNYKQISELLEWDEKNAYFFLIQIYKRKKDQSEDDGQKADNIMIKDYFIKSADHFDKIYPEIVKLCNFFNARAYIRLNMIPYDAVAMETLAIVVECLQKGNQRNVKSAYTTACGRRCYDKNKKWLLDIDSEDNLTSEEMHKRLLDIRPEGNKVIAEIPTKNGFHLITEPFDVKQYSDKYGSINNLLNKNNPTLLYIP